jgi:hypothetical protein
MGHATAQFYLEPLMTNGYRLPNHPRLAARLATVIRFGRVCRRSYWSLRDAILHTRTPALRIAPSLEKSQMVHRVAPPGSLVATA